MDVCASMRPQGGGIAATIVNRHPTAGRDVTLVLPPAFHSASGSCRLLVADGLGPDAGMTERPGPLSVPATGRLSVAVPPYSVGLLEIGESDE